MVWRTTSGLLVDLASFSNDTAWRRLSRGLRAPTYEFARSMGLSHSDAEDAVQDCLFAFAVQFRRGSYDRKKGRLSNWLFGIAYREIVRHRRQLARQRERDVTTRTWRSLLCDRRHASPLRTSHIYKKNNLAREIFFPRARDRVASAYYREAAPFGITSNGFLAGQPRFVLGR